MTFDDGILTICETKDISSPGGMPKIELKRKDEYHFPLIRLGFIGIIPLCRQISRLKPW